MNSVQLTSIVLTLSLYVILGVAFFGWGKAVWATAGFAEHEQEIMPATFSIWIGWACALFLFNLLHFFSPLTFFTVTPVFIFGIVFSLIFFLRRKKLIGSFVKSSWITISFVIFFMMILSIWIALRSMLPPSTYDSNLYHFNAVRWINSFPVIPGLGNLHSRLAFNQSFFTYVAVLNLYPFFGQGRSIANSFLLVLTILTLIELLLPVIKKPAFASQVHPLHLGALFSFPIIIFLMLSSNGLDSPSPDLASTLIQFIIFIVFSSELSVFAKKRIFSVKKGFFLSILSLISITLKLSSLAFSSIIILITFILSFTSSSNRYRDSVKFILPIILIFSSWYLHGVILSGYPLYPSMIGHIQTEWSVPANQVIDLANWVYSWARQPGTHWKNVLGNWNWIDSWLENIAQNHFIDVVFPSIVFLAGGIASIIALPFLKWKERRTHYIELIIIIPLITGLIFWFSTAPDPRFANALFMLLPVSIAIIFLSIVQSKSNKIFLLVTYAFFAIESTCLVTFVYSNQSISLKVSNSGWQDSAQPPLIEKITKHGLRVFTPVNPMIDDRCGDAPLPCTPYFNENLRLRKPGDLASGFTVQDKTN